jgi:CRP/FNR family transcriptional regulator, global nitrogen regulator
MINETVGKGSTPRRFPHRTPRDTADLHALNATPAPVRTDVRGQEGREFLDLLHEAGAATVERRYARAEVIFGEGDPGNALYVLTEGVVKLSRGYAGGKEATLMLLGPWEVFGELAFGREVCQHARAETVTACRVRKIPKVFVERVVHRRPEAALKVVDLLRLELVRHREMAGCLMPHKAEAKLAKLLPILARKFGDEEEGRLVIRLRLTQEELAKMISSTRESVTHALADLRRRGVLAVVGGRIVILDPAGLANTGRALRGARHAR